MGAQTQVDGRLSAIERQQAAIAMQKAGLALQRASVLRQRSNLQSGPLTTPNDSAAFFELPSDFPAAFAPECAPASPMILQNAVSQAASKYSVSPELIHAVIRQESAGFPCALSEKGAMGLMQLMPATATQMGVDDPFDVRQNVAGGTQLLSELMERYRGDLNRVLGAYNAGPAAVDGAGGIPPFPETINYIRSILEKIKPDINTKLFLPPIR